MTQAANLTEGVPQAPPFASTDVGALLLALTTCHRGVSRPAVLTNAPSGQKDGFWIKTVSSTAWEWNYYDGTSDVLIGTVDPTAHTFTPSGNVGSKAVTPAQITANQNNYAPTGLAAAGWLRLSSDASRDITGLDATGVADGALKILHNVGSYNIVLKSASSSSSATNRFALTADITLAPDAVTILQRDATSSRWRAVAGGGGSGLVAANNLSDVASAATSADNLGVLRYAAAQSLTSGQKAQVQENAGLPSLLRGWGMGTTWLSTSSFSVAAGMWPDSTGAKAIALAASITKTTGSWTVGSGNGALDTGSIEASKWYYKHAVLRSDTGVVDVILSLAPGTTGSVNISNASPGVVTWTGHGLQANAPVMFTTTPATGLSANTQYFVKTVLSVDTFTVSATQGGSAINTSGSASGVTAVSKPVLPASYDYSVLIGFVKTNGSSQLIKWIQDGDDWTWDAPVQEVNGVDPGTTAAVTRTLTGAPLALRTQVNFTQGNNNVLGASNTAVWLTDLATTAPTPSSTFNNLFTAAGVTTATVVRAYTDTSARIRTQHSFRDANTLYFLVTQSLTWRRGKN